MNVLLSLILTTSLLLLSGCTSFLFGEDVKPVEVVTKKEERARLNLADPTPLSMRPVEWVVITPENAEEVWTELQQSNTDLVLFGLTDEGYENLAINIANIRNMMNQQRIIIIKYKDYYEPNKEVDFLPVEESK